MKPMTMLAPAVYGPNEAPVAIAVPSAATVPAAIIPLEAKKPIMPLAITGAT